MLIITCFSRAVDFIMEKRDKYFWRVYNKFKSRNDRVVYLFFK